jgi:hypothetical protein
VGFSIDFRVGFKVGVETAQKELLKRLASMKPRTAEKITMERVYTKDAGTWRSRGPEFDTGAVRS